MSEILDYVVFSTSNALNLKGFVKDSMSKVDRGKPIPVESIPPKRFINGWVELIKGTVSERVKLNKPMPPAQTMTSQTTTVEPTKSGGGDTLESPTPPAYEFEQTAISDSGLGTSRSLSTLSKISATGSMKALERAWKDLESNKSKSWVNYLKLAVALLVPMTAICVLCAFSLINNQQFYWDANVKLQAMQVSDAYGSLTESLQQERGIACVLLNTNSDGQLIVWQNLIGLQGKTNAALGSLTNWVPSSNNDKTFATKEAFQAALNKFRTTVASMVITCDDVIRWYSNKTQTLMQIRTLQFRQTAEGIFWQRTIAYNCLFIAQDFLGLVRAYGSRFFIGGGLSHEDYIQFLEYYGIYTKYMGILQQRAITSVTYIANTINRDHADLVDEINYLVSMITYNNISNPNFTAAEIWFDNSTSYSSLLAVLGMQISNNMLIYMDSSLSTSYGNLVAVIVIVTIIAIICPPVLIWYAVNNQQLMTNSQAYVQLVFMKTEELDREKKKTEGILNQLLPPAIVGDLKRGKKILPELYESVTIYQSDVKGFTALSSRSSPMEIVDLLNELYTNFDNILDRYDVYKVETIGDAYVVVSGAPRRNGDKHATEICTVALEICQMLDQFYIPHMPTEKLLLRIGVHSGSCVAGVVGVKMPRYCLFGEAVSTAAKMESSGQAACVQISSCTHNIVQNHDPHLFDVEPRGIVDVPGKGDISTFWLLGKRDFAYRIELERSLRQVHKYDYWRM